MICRQRPRLITSTAIGSLGLREIELARNPLLEFLLGQLPRGDLRYDLLRDRPELLLVLIVAHRLAHNRTRS